MTDAEFEELYEASISAAIASGGVTEVTVDGQSFRVNHTELIALLTKERARRTSLQPSLPARGIRFTQLVPPGGGG